MMVKKFGGNCYVLATRIPMGFFFLFFFNATSLNG